MKPARKSTGNKQRAGKPVVAIPKDASPPNPKEFRIVDSGKKPQAALLAELAVSPHVNAMMTVQAYAQPIFKDVGVTELVDELQSQVAAVRAGNMDRAEAMLVAQAHSLDAIYAEMARIASLNIANNLPAAETCLKLALRAQSQCRATVETLGTIKNPPVFAKQANIAHGPQQVNNGVACEPTRAEEKAIEPTELLEHDHGERMDTGTTSAASTGDPVMATVGTLDRAAHGRGKGRRKP